MRATAPLWAALQIASASPALAGGQVASPGRTAEGDSVLAVGRVNLRYRVQGQGPAVVLIHGFAGRLEDMSALADALAPTFRVIRFDARGFGESSHPHDPADFGVRLADDVIALLDHVGERRAALVGYSLGAAIAGKAAARHPARIDRLVLIGGGPLTDSSRIMRISEDAASALEQGRGLRPFLAALTPPGRPLPTDSVMGAVSREVLAGRDSLAWAALVRSQRALTVSVAEGRKLRMPTFLVAGSDDPLAVEARQWQRRLSNARFLVVPRATHDDVLARTEVTWAVRAFLRRERAP